VRTLANCALLITICLPACWDASDRGGGSGSGSGGSGGGGSGGGGSGGGPLCPALPASGSPAPWFGVVGTGQSLSTGNTPVLTTAQPFNNLKLSLGTTVVPPWDASSCALAMVPLVEPLRAMGGGFPRPYPGNIWGETPHSAMANQITTLVKAANASADYVTVHTAVGESGQGMVALKKQTGDTAGTTGRAYAATLFEAEAITRLARASGRSYAVAAIVMTHGETDSGSSSYHDELVQLRADYDADLKAITGQTTDIPMFLSQQFAYPSGAGQRPVANQVQWQLGVERPGLFVCTGPKYQYPGHGDGIHLATAGYQQLGEKTGQIYHERIVLGRDWQPLQPTRAERSGRTITVHFHVPVPPLRWEESFPPPTAWANGRGFEVRAGGAKIEIAGVQIAGDTVQITCASDPPASGVTIGYALTSGDTMMSNASRAYRWGQLRDSDPFVGSTTGVAQPNFAVSFEIPVP
jgi:hypothetical protein